MSSLILLFWDRDERRLRAGWRISIFLLLIVLLLGLADALISAVAIGAAASVLRTTATLLLAVLSAWLAARLLDRRSFSELGLKLGRTWWRDCGFGLVLGALLMTGIFLVEWAAGWLSIISVFQTTIPVRYILWVILLPLLAFVVVGIVEELIFRGYLLRNLAEGLNFSRHGERAAVLLAWLSSSLLFGAAHAANPHASTISTVSLVLAGLLLGLGYVLTGQLAMPIGLHISWNFFQGSIYGFAVSGIDSNQFSGASLLITQQEGPELWTGGAFGPEAGLLGLIAMLVGGVLTILWVRFRYGRAELHRPLATAPTRAHNERADIGGGAPREG